MKLKYILSAVLLMPILSSCLKEYTPTGVATDEQLQNADKSGLSNAVSGYMTTSSAYSDGGLTSDVGFLGFGLYRDAMSADFPVYDSGYDYFGDFNYQTYIGNTSLLTLFWQRYYYLIQKTNLLIGVAKPDELPQDRIFLGNALAYRAMAYFDLARMYEFKHTGVEKLDNDAKSKGIDGLTVPIVTEETSDADHRNNPRVPYYTLYRFIQNDLNNAEKLLSSTHSASSKTQACLGVVYGLKARFYLELGTRYTLHPSDLSEALSHETDSDIAYPIFGLLSAEDCFKESAKFARKAINEGFMPLTQNQWYDPTTGFNSPNNSWLWCVTISADDPAVNLDWQSFVSFVSPEASWGVACNTYKAYRLIDAKLYSEISDSDWRKETWINPQDAGNYDAFSSKYAKGTSMSYDEWKVYNGYAGFKFHPGNGDRNTSTVGNAISMPLMRVEEMYLIEAEAKGHCEGVTSGKALLENFLNSYRYKDGSYSCQASSIEELVNEIFEQKRVELWGEGLILWDYKRLEKAIIRDYEGSNHPDVYKFNSYDNAVAPWTNFYIPDSERNFNRAVILNPDPSAAIAARITE